MKVICISGKARHGKDTLASMMKNELEKINKRVLITHYADLLKYICKNFFNWDGEKDEKGRHLLQYIGTDVVRNKDENYWVKFVSDMLSISEDRWDYVLIPDTRFPNEINYLKERGCDVFTIRIIRDGFENNLGEINQTHESETALDNYKFDKTIKNNSITDLKEEVLRTINEMGEAYEM